MINEVKQQFNQQIKQQFNQQQQLKQQLKQELNQELNQKLNQELNQELKKQEEMWIICPACHNKTRTRVRADTVLLNFPLYCPKCRQEHLINVQQLNISVITEPDAQMQSR